MAENLTEMPPAFIAGDTLTFTQTFSDYPASAGWSCSWYFSGPSAFNIAATTSGAAFLVTLSAAASAALTPGDYTFTARVSKDGVKHTAASGEARVCRDPANTAANAHYVAWKFAETKYSAAVASGLQSGEDGNKNFSKFELKSLHDGMLSLKIIYERDLKKDQLALGNATNSGRIAVTFK